MKYKALFFWLVFGLICSQINAQSHERSKEVSRTFKTGSETEIRISNKYGNIHVIPWDKDSVRFEVEISIRSNKSAKVEKAFDNIDLSFISTKHNIIAETVFRNQGGSFWQDVSDFAGIIFKNGTQADINYKVYLPADNDLSILNKFGNVYVTKHNGEFRLELSNGDLKVNELTGKAMITVNFGNARIDKMARGRLDVGYADMEIEEAGSLSISSKSSTLIINTVEEMDIDSRRDKFYIDEVMRFNGRSSFSYLNLENVWDQLIMTTNYGDMSIDHLGANFTLVKLEAAYTGVDIRLPDQYSSDVEITYSSKTSLMLPHAFDALDKKQIGNEEKFLLTGSINKDGSNNAQLKVNISSGSLNIF